MDHRTNINQVEPDFGPSIESLADDLLGVAKRKKRLILLFAIAITATVYFGLQFISDKYDANAFLIVKLGAENADVPMTVDKGTVHRQGVMKEEVNTYISLMKSFPLLESVVDEIGLQRFQSQAQTADNPIQWVKIQLKSVARWGKARLNDALIVLNLRARLSDRDLVIIGLQRNLHIEQEKDSNVIYLNLRLPDPVLAKDVLEILIQNYLELHKERFLGDNEMLAAFESQVAQHQNELKDWYAELSQSRRLLGVSSIEDRRRALEALAQSIEGELLENRRKLAQTEKTGKQIASNVNRIEELVLSEKLLQPNASRGAIERGIAELAVMKTGLLSDFLETSPQVQAVEYEIDSLQTQLSSESAESTLSLKYVRNPVRTQFETQLEAMSVEKASLASLIAEAESQLKDIRDEANRLNESDASINQLELAISVAEQRLLNAARKFEEAKTRDLLSKNNVANVSVLIAPSYNPKPAAPRRLLLLVAAAIGSIGFGFAVALFLEWQDQRVYDLADLRRIRNVIPLGHFRFEEK